MKKPAILLCRISDLKQDDGYSLDAQSKLGTDYCQANDLEILKEFRFVETASKPGKRGKFNEIIQFIKGFTKKTKVSLHLVVEKHDRLTRNFTDKERLQEFTRLGLLEIHYFKEKKIIDKDFSPAEVFNEDIMTAVGKYHSLNTRNEVLKGMKEKASQGWYPSHAPLGYKNARQGLEDRNGRKEAVIIIDPDERNVKAAQRVFELRAEKSLSYYEIARSIKAEHILPPHKAKSFSKRSVERILKNPFYTGQYEWNGELFNGKHELIIDKVHLKTVFSREKKLISKRASGVFSSFITCADTACGCQVVYDPKIKINRKSGKKTRYNYYHCTDGKMFHKEAGEKQVNVSEEQLFKEFEKAVKDICISAKLAKGITEILRKGHEQTLAQHRRTMQGYKDALLALEDQEDELYTDHKKGLLSEKAYKRQLENVRKERRRFTQLLEDNEAKIHRAFFATVERTLELAKDVERLWLKQTPQERVELLKDILSNQMLKGRTIEYDLKKPFKILAEMKKNEENGKWCSRRESNPHASRH